MRVNKCKFRPKQKGGWEDGRYGVRGNMNRDRVINGRISRIVYLIRGHLICQKYILYFGGEDEVFAYAKH